MSRILETERLERIKKYGAGYIVITGKPGSVMRLHRANCQHIDLNNFYKKVIENNEENGSYYWFNNRKNAMKEFDAKACSVCL